MAGTNEIIIDGVGCVAGRIAAFAAKKALQGEKIIILNCKDIVIIGKKKDILQKYKDKFALGGEPQKGPHFNRVSDKIMRRIIRGMLPRKRTKGREAFRRVSCFRDVPEKYKSTEKMIVAKADAINFITLSKICKLLGKEQGN
jgi:large subunit ribosomal protein L13